MAHPLTLSVSIDPDVKDFVQGVFKVDGHLALDEEGREVRFTYRTGDWMGSPSDLRTATIAVDDLRSVAKKPWIPGPRLVLYAKRLDRFDGIPGARSDALTLNVAYDQRSEAGLFAVRLQQLLLDEQLIGTVSIAFKLPDQGLGLIESKGLMYLDDEFLVFELSSGVSGLTPSKDHVVKIEPAALRRVELEQGVFRDTLRVYPKKPALLNAMPGDHTQAVKLYLARSNRRDAEQFVYELRRRMHETASRSAVGS